MGLDEAAQAEPMRRSEKKRHTSHCKESDTVDANGCNSAKTTRSVDPKCAPKPFDPDAACKTSVYDELIPQQFQDYIPIAPPTTRWPKKAIRKALTSVPKRTIKKGMSGARTSRRHPSKPSGRLLVLVSSFGK
jgi:hypothetical protein